MRALRFKTNQYPREYSYINYFDLQVPPLWVLWGPNIWYMGTWTLWVQVFSHGLGQVFITLVIGPLGISFEYFARVTLRTLHSPHTAALAKIGIPHSAALVFLFKLHVCKNAVRRSRTATPGHGYDLYEHRRIMASRHGGHGGDLPGLYAR